MRQDRQKSAGGRGNGQPRLPATATLVDFTLAAIVPLEDEDFRERVMHPLVDTVGVSIAGSATAVAAAVGGMVGRDRADHATNSPPLEGGTGALVLGTVGHALDYDDSVPLMPGHPSAPVLAALMASTPPQGVSGRRFVEAYAIGVEAAAKIGKSVGGGHYKHGWHATSTHAGLGAVLALGRLADLDRETLSNALGIAVSTAAGVQCNFGTMVKPLHVGLAAQRAVVAVQLATAGVTACTNALEAPQGYLDVFGDEHTRPEVLMEELGTDWAFNDPGVYLKRYPCCYAVHRAIFGVQAILERASVDPDAVREIECLVPIGGLRPLRFGLPTTGLEAKFSLEYAIAATLVDGDVTLESFDDRAVNRAAIQRLMHRCRIVETPDCSPDDLDGLHGSAGTRGHIRLRVVMESGQTLETTVHTPPGAAGARLTEDDVTRKFVDCVTSTGVGELDARGLLADLMTIDSAADASAVVTTVRRICSSVLPTALLASG